MDRSLRFAVSLLLITSLVHGSGQTQEDGALPEVRVSTASSEIRVTKATRFERVGPGEQLPDSMEEYRGKESNKDERKPRQEVEEEYEGEDEDEYEEELKAVAESHEAMSRDEQRNSNISSINETRPAVTSERLPAVKSFDSHEVTVTNFSDEDTASNEAITAEVLDKTDQEECELLKFKKGKNPKLCRTDKEKMKRVPTVKKELSTQKEILIASNETQLAESIKSLLAASQETVNRLGEKTKRLRRRGADETMLSREVMKIEWEALNIPEKLDRSTIKRTRLLTAKSLAQVRKEKKEYCEKGLAGPEVLHKLEKLEDALLGMIDIMGAAEEILDRKEMLQMTVADLEEMKSNAESTLEEQREEVDGQSATTISPEPVTVPSPTTSTESL